MATSDSKQGGFTVTDRRGFTEGGEARPGAASPEAANPKAASPGAPGPSAASKGLEESGPEGTGLPAVDFHTFVLSLGSSALLHLGELEDPEGGQAEKDLAMAKHTIDILSMLQEKTKGNLSAAEDKLMESLLYDLRLRYVNASK